MAVLQILVFVMLRISYTNANDLSSRKSLHLRRVLKHCVPIAFVQKTHILTDRFLESAMRVKEQVERCGGYHRVLYFSSEDSLANGDPDELLQAFRLALGEHSVIGIGPADVSVAFGLEWGDLNALANGHNFMWYRADAYEITWYELFSGELPNHIHHIWFAEYDVDFTGDLPQLLSSFSPKADFVCSLERKTNGLQIDPAWPHFYKRNWLADSEVRQCLVMLVRYSRRLLTAIRAETKMGRSQFCEITGASICTRHHRWCTAEGFDHTHHIIGRNPDNNETLFSWAVNISQEEWANITASVSPHEPGHLYHAVKW